MSFTYNSFQLNHYHIWPFGSRDCVFIYHIDSARSAVSIFWVLIAFLFLLLFISRLLVALSPSHFFEYAFEIFIFIGRQFKRVCVVCLNLVLRFRFLLWFLWREIALLTGLWNCLVSSWKATSSKSCSGVGLYLGSIEHMVARTFFSSIETLSIC